MTSPVNDEEFPAWSQKGKWTGLFHLKWISIKNVPFTLFKDLKNPLNKFKFVFQGRDTQEIYYKCGYTMIKRFMEFDSSQNVMSQLMELTKSGVAIEKEEEGKEGEV